MANRKDEAEEDRIDAHADRVRPSPDGREWERWVGETEKQFLAFKAFRDIPAADRSILEAYRRHTRKPHAALASSWFYELSKVRKWRERAAAFDAHLDRLTWDAEVDERMKIRKLRRAGLITAYRKTAEAIAKMDFAKASVSEIGKLVDALSRNLREEYDDAPEARQQVTLVNGGTSELVQLADAASEMSDEDVVAQYRRITGTQRKALTGGGS